MQHQEIVDKLSKVDIFSNSPKEVLEDMAKVVKVLQPKTNTNIIQKGEEGNCMYIMTQGKVKIHEGQHTIVELEGMQVFGELALLNTEPRTASVTTIQDSTLLRLDQDDFYNVIASSVEVTQGIIRMLTKRLRIQNENIIESLKKREKELMQLVEERTADLQREKAKLEKAYDEISAKNDSLSQANEEIAEKTKNITASINYAKRIQDALLPQTAWIKNQFPESFILFKPRDIVSGDCYWYGQHKDLSLFAAIDCTGHGVPGALMSMIGNTLLNQIVNMRGTHKPSRILQMLHAGVRKALKQDKEDSRSRDGMDLAFFTFNHQEKNLQYAGANRPLLLIKPDGDYEEIKPDKRPIGGRQFEEDKSFTNHTFNPQPGTRIYLSSDGYADQFGGPKNRKFMKKRLREMILENHHKPMQEQHRIYQDALANWMRAYRQIDDILLTGFQLD